MNVVNSHAVATLEKALQRRLEKETHSSTQQNAGLFRAAEILSVVDRSTSSALYEHLAVEAPQLAEQVHRLTLRFDQLNTMSDGELRLVLRTVEIPIWAIAMKGCSDTLCEKIRQNLTEKDLFALEANEERARSASDVEIESAQLDIVRAIYRLRYEGKIFDAIMANDRMSHFSADRSEAA